jgi:hypothetical protein
MVFKRFVMSLLLVIPILIGSQKEMWAQSNQSPFVYAVEWSESGDVLVVVRRDGITVYDRAYQPVSFHPFPPDITFSVPDVVLSPDGSYILVNTEIWRIDTLESVTALQEPDILPYSAQWNPDSTRIAFRTGAGWETRIYNVANGSILRRFSGGVWSKGFTPTWSPNELYFATLNDFTIVSILDALSGTTITEFPLNVNRIMGMSWSPDSTHLAVQTQSEVPPGTPGSFPMGGGRNESKSHLISIYIVEALTGSISTSIERVPGFVNSLAWNRSGSQIAAETSFDGILIWNTKAGMLEDSFPSPPSSPLSLGFSSLGGRLFLGRNPALPLPSGTLGPFQPMSNYRQDYLNDVVVMVMPAPSPGKLSDIISQCNLPSEVNQSLESSIDSNDLAGFLQQIGSLSDNQISPDCRDELTAVAEALVYREQSSI